ncbi:UFD1-domain-containing protein [Atractiella rhizophila]|nr:UFD1-domain-containing protein [Atractiella rhizophila]
MGYGGHPLARAPPRAFNKAYTAYSTAILESMAGRGDRVGRPGRSAGGRDNLMYGGKIIMPPSALQQLTNLDLESPWTFELKNPHKDTIVTHAGVLEFIADEGNVHLPQWMMERLQLVEGDVIRITGCKLPKGKRVKIQPQSVDFLQLSDPKAVLEQALRNFSCLTANDIIEISYNSLIFRILIRSIIPEDAPGISVLDTDLEVEFEAPLGYVEPDYKAEAAKRSSNSGMVTLAERLKINIDGKEIVDQNGKRSGAGTPLPKEGNAKGKEKEVVQEEPWEAFKGRGNTLTGKRIKGKGVSAKKIEDVAESSKIFRTGQPKIITAETQIGGRQIPATLDLPDGVLFFGFAKKPPPKDIESSDLSSTSNANVKKEKENVPFAGLSGQGNTLSGGKSTQSRGGSASATAGRKRDWRKDVIEIDD